VTVRLLLDEMYPPDLAETLRAKGHDVLAVAAISELVGTPDTAVLNWATSEGRCLVTGNVRDYVVLAGYTKHCGVLLVNAQRWPRTRSGLPRLFTALDAAIVDGRAPGPGEVGWLGPNTAAT
jgi:hypothetical protein